MRGKWNSRANLDQNQIFPTVAEKREHIVTLAVEVESVGEGLAEEPGRTRSGPGVAGSHTP